jgi:hypothetical protein
MSLCSGIEGYFENLNCFRFEKTQAPKEERNMCRRHHGATGEEGPHPRYG